MSSYCGLFLRKGTNGVTFFHLVEKKCEELSTLRSLLLCQTYLNAVPSNKFESGELHKHNGFKTHENRCKNTTECKGE